MRGDNATRWQQTEPSGWQFAITAKSQIERDKATAPPPDTGFLNAYGATTPEKDFNVYAENMMTDMHAVMDLARAHPIVARKAAFVRACYSTIDSRMAAVFGSLGMDLRALYQSRIMSADPPGVSLHRPPTISPGCAGSY